VNHRRPNPGELTPDDLFRPEGEPTAAYAESGYAEPHAAPPAPEPQAASTQFLPPMPPAPHEQATAYPQQAPYGQPQPQGYEPYPQYQDHQGYQEQPYQDQYHQSYDGYDDEPRRSGPSMRTLAIGVVAACAVVGIGLGAMLSGGTSAASPRAGASAATKQAANVGATTASGQAKALSALLDSASTDRNAVINAVGDIQQCQGLQQAQQTLAQAAQSRAQLMQQLEALKTDQLPQGGALVGALQRGWQASQQADSHYAIWAAQSQGVCQKHHHPKAGGESAALTASGTATQAKKQAASLWNPIAAANGLPSKQAYQL
jgi:hypothetical protein